MDVRENDKSLVEIKSKTSSASVFDLGVKTAVQLTCNTSETLLCARLDKNGTIMKSVSSMSTQDYIKKHKNAFIYAGQRVTYMLEKLSADNQVVDARATGQAIEMTFNEGKDFILRPVSGV